MFLKNYSVASPVEDLKKKKAPNILKILNGLTGR